MDTKEREFFITKKILKTIDPMIKRLIININLLSFVRKTNYSCSGNFEFGNKKGEPYIVIEYYTNKVNRKIVKNFNRDILTHPLITLISSRYEGFSLFKTLSTANYRFCRFDDVPFENLKPREQKEIIKHRKGKPDSILKLQKLDRKQAIQALQYFHSIVKKYLKEYQK
ncbi:MAG: hypothetical protein CMH63_02430 [Nanoarchaeota archaeon]|nr:hypothetical protein [Nanoarchaeota archaeon]|tara:strand:- start:543 stop:1049 length:507 start_codon:yes stop_codon:yes gene_type:complete